MGRDYLRRVVPLAAMTTHEKLVRDRIPELIRAEGRQVETRALDDVEYLEALVAKLSEECAEFTAARSLEELADVLEVIHSLAATIGSIDELERVRIAKRDSRGGFDSRTWLISTD